MLFHKEINIVGTQRVSQEADNGERTGQPLKSWNYFMSRHFCKKEPRLDISRLHHS